MKVLHGVYELLEVSIRYGSWHAACYWSILPGHWMAPQGPQGMVWTVALSATFSQKLSVFVTVLNLTSARVGPYCVNLFLSSKSKSYYTYSIRCTVHALYMYVKSTWMFLRASEFLH